MPEEGDIPQQQREPLLGNETILPTSLWTQLSRLARKPIPNLRSDSLDPDSWRGTHAGDELEMAETTKDHIDEVTAFIFTDEKEGSILTKNNFGKDVSLMILTGDMGKAGGKLLSPHDPEPVVARMYIDLFIDQRHAVAIGVSSVGQLMEQPISTILEGAQRVAKVLDPSNERDFETRYALSDAETKELADLGYPPDTFPIGAFFSQAHVKEGEKLLLDNPDLTEEQKKLAIVGLSHHFSQNVLPDGISGIDLGDKSVMRTIAYLEVLDKVHANIFRGKKTPAEAIETTNNTIQGLLNRNKESIPNCPSDVEKVYKEVIQFFKETQLFPTS